MFLPFSLTRAAADVALSLRDFSFSFDCLPGAACHDGNDVKWCYTGAPRLNRVMSVRFEAASADARIEEVLAFYAARHVPATWFVGPADTPADLTARLAVHGLHHRGDWTGMAFDLAALPDEDAGTASLSIVAATDADGDQEWARTAAEGFNMPVQSAAAFAQVISAVGDRLRHCSRRYIGYHEGRPAATSALYLANGLAGIYYVGTVPAARRRGLATAMTRHALAEAKAAGYLTAVLQASPAGAPVYRAMGFVACSTIALYDFTPPAGPAGA